MVSNCSNPDCGTEFLYLYDGELFVLKLPNKGVEYYWLCPSCSPYMRVIYDTGQRAVAVVTRSGVLDAVRSVVRMAIKKPVASETVYRGSSRKVWS